MRFSVITIFALLASLAGGAVAQISPRAGNSSRILKSFDFDERKDGNNEDQPMNWTKLDGRDFPHYVTGRLTTDRHRSGNYSFRMDLDGGNCIYRYKPGLLKVQPGAHYRAEVFCQTTTLRYARARLTAYFTDQDLHPLPETVHHSDLYRSDDGDDSWHPLSVELTADQDHAYYLVVQMELLQPDQYSTSSLGKRSLFLQDVHGTAWFDDLTVAQVPQVVLKTDRPGNVFRQGDPLKLTVDVNDRETDDLTVQLMVSDAENRQVYQRTSGVDISGAKTLPSGLRELTLDLPAVKAGWYRAALMMMSHGVYVGQESLAWILLADEGDPSGADPRFGMNATNLPFENWGDLPRFLPLLSVGRVKLALWSSTADIQQQDSEVVDQLLESLQSENISPTGCLLALPPKIADSLNGSNWLQVLNAPSDSWATPLAFLISRHANRVDRWQLGADDTDEFALSADMRKVHAKVVRQFASLVDRPDVAMPCPLLYDLPNPQPSSLTLSVGTSILPAEIPLYLQDYRGRDSQAVTVSLSLLEKDQYSRETRICDLARRIVYLLASDVPRIDLPLPITSRQQGDQLVAEPQEAMIIMRTLLSTLSGSRYRGTLPIARDIDAFLFEKSGQGIVVLWNKNDVADSKTMAVSLGEHPMRIDLWGNTAPLLQLPPPTGDDDAGTRRHAASGLVQLNVGRVPIILTGIDIDMGRLRSSLCFDQPLIESSFQSHTRHIRFTNPYHQPIGGVLKLHAPPGWNLTPPTFNFTLNTGETFDRELTIEFPYNSIAGPQPFLADFDLQADRHISFTEPVALTLGLSDVGTQCMAFRDQGDVVVQQMITNYGEQPITYSAFANYPGRPRIERLVASLNPGQTAVKKYRFTKVPVDEKSRIRVGLKEVDGNRILNDEVEIK
jgi:hypothetical protein